MRDEYGATHFPPHFHEASGQKRALLHPPLHGPKGMGNNPLARFALLRMGGDSWLPLFQQHLVPPAGKAAVLFVPGALGFEWAGFTGCGRVIATRSAWFGGGKAQRPFLIPWPSIAILGRLIEAIFFAQEASFPVGRGIGRRNRGHNTLIAALFAFLPIVVAPIRHGLELRRGKRLLGALCHGGELIES